MEESKKNVIITYETLFEMVRRERDRDTLQKLEPSFFEDVIHYLKEKRKILEAQLNLSNIEERRKAEKELENIKKVLRELYERREKKIISMALDKSRTQTNLSDIQCMLQEEKQLFDRLVEILDKGRNSIFFPMLKGDMPSSLEILCKEESSDLKAAGDTKKEEKSNTPDTLEPAEPKRNTKLIRFVHAVPKFVGTELEEYGPFDEEDIATLPTEIADVLILKERAEEIKES